MQNLRNYSNKPPSELYGFLHEDPINTNATLPKESILRNFEKFFKYSGGLIHPRKRDPNGLPLRVTKLADYQIKFANMDRAVMLKNNKAGVTMSESINDFRTLLLPEYAGFDCLLVGQNQTMANEHLLNLKRWVLASPTMKDFMILDSDNQTRLREEKSKMQQMYIYNPYDPKRRSRIIAIGFSESLAYSWANIIRLHISDPGQNTRKNQYSFFSGLYSRLSNTEGQIKIEGVAGERSGYFYELCKKLWPELDDQEIDLTDPMLRDELDMEEMKDMSTSFQKIMIDADDSVRAGLITKEWLAYMRGILPKDEFLRIYYHKFAKPFGTIFDSLHVGEHMPLNVEDVLKK